MSLFSTLLFITFGMVLLGVIALIAFSELSMFFNRNRQEFYLAHFRGKPILETPNGYWFVHSYKKYSNTEYHYTLRDKNGNMHQLDVHAHELHPVNIFQLINGPGNPVFRYTPSSDAGIIAAQASQQARDVRIMHEFKLQSERATKDAKIAEAKHRERANEILEQHRDIERAKQAPAGKK